MTRFERKVKAALDALGTLVQPTTTVHLGANRCVVVGTDVVEYVTAMLKPYAHIICEHDFKSTDSACERWTCSKCGMRNPRWEWRRPLNTYYFGGIDGPSMPSLCTGKWAAVQLDDGWWEYREWPKGKKR